MFNDIEQMSNTIIKTGLCHYGIKTYRSFICLSDFFPDTGDYEDSDELCYDKEEKCYCVWFEDFLNKGKICAGGGYFHTLDEAICSVKSITEFERWI